MKMIIVTNGNLAASLKESLTGYFYQPDCRSIGFCFPNHEIGTAELAIYLAQCQEKNPQENFLFLVDDFGTTAYNETVLLLRKTGLDCRSLVLTGVNLPQLIKLYGLKDSVSLNYLRSLYNSCSPAAATVPAIESCDAFAS